MSPTASHTCITRARTGSGRITPVVRIAAVYPASPACITSGLLIVTWQVMVEAIGADDSAVDYATARSTRADWHAALGADASRVSVAPLALCLVVRPGRQGKAATHMVVGHVAEHHILRARLTLLQQEIADTTQAHHVRQDDLLAHGEPELRLQP